MDETYIFVCLLEILANVVKFVNEYVIFFVPVRVFGVGKVVFVFLFDSHRTHWSHWRQSLISLGSGWERVT